MSTESAGTFNEKDKKVGDKSRVVEFNSYDELFSICFSYVST
jgi:hypothetical protein